MGDDEYHPMSHRGSNLSLSGGIGYTVVDAIDTMQIMSLKPEYSRARQWIKSTLTFDRQGNFNTFEVRYSPVSALNSRTLNITTFRQLSACLEASSLRTTFHKISSSWNAQMTWVLVY